jgi:hypothetical protein
MQTRTDLTYEELLALDENNVPRQLDGSVVEAATTIEVIESDRASAHSRRAGRIQNDKVSV